MAEVNPVQNLQEDSTCPICLEYYKDPVTTECGHNFCRACITGCWEGAGTEGPCPQCRQICPQRSLRPNRQLQSMVELVKQLSLQAVRAQEENLCEEHEEKLKLFCKEDQKLICVICQVSEDHKSPPVSPVKEAALENMAKLQDWLHTLKKELEGVLASKLKEEAEYQTVRNTLENERLKIVGEFERLHQLLKEHEQTLISRLEEMERKITMAECANIGKLSSQISTLGALITEMEEKCQQPAGQLLKDVKSTLTRCEIMKLQNREAIKKRHKVRVTLDPDTAIRSLNLSEEARLLKRADTAQILLNNPRRFTATSCVLGREGFTSGQHYWELQILQDGEWAVGVARESVPRKKRVTETPEGGVWAVQRDWIGQYRALTSPPSLLSLLEPPSRLGLYLDYEEGRLSLYNADTMQELYTFTRAAFSERVFPYFRLYNKIFTKLCSEAELRLV